MSFEDQARKRRPRTPNALRGLLVTCALVACEDTAEVAVGNDESCLTGRDGNRYCIDRFEASRFDASVDREGTDEGEPRTLPARRPWTNVTWFQAQDACRRAGKRLCSRAEWEDACDGVVGDGGTRFTYGDVEDDTVCNVTGGSPVATGSFEGCVSVFDTSDQSGNVWEWTGETSDDALALGGSFRSSIQHRCTSGSQIRVFGLREESDELGFRCCRDP